MKAALVLALVVALLGNGFTHAAVPHDHGGHHAEVVWGELHAVLQHQEKTLLFLAPFLPLFLFLLSFVCRPLLSFVEPFLLRSSPYEQNIRRGIELYRRFG